MKDIISCGADSDKRESEATQCLKALERVADNMSELRALVESRLAVFVHSEYDSQPQPAYHDILSNMTAPYFIETANKISRIYHAMQDINTRLTSCEL